MKWQTACHMEVDFISIFLRNVSNLVDWRVLAEGWDFHLIEAIQYQVHLFFNWNIKTLAPAVYFLLHNKLNLTTVSHFSLLSAAKDGLQWEAAD